MNYPQVKVRTSAWENSDGSTIPGIRIYVGKVRVFIPFEETRRIVDQIHDLTDEWEAKQR